MSSDGNALPPLLALTLSTEDYGAERNTGRRAGNRKERMGRTSPTYDGRPASRSPSPTSSRRVPSCTANMMNYRRWEDVYKWIDTTAPAPDTLGAGMWRKYEGDFDWRTKSVLDICDNVIRYVKYPKYYWLREGNTQGEDTMMGGECVNLQEVGGYSKNHPRGQFTHNDNSPAYMAKVQHLVSAEAVLELGILYKKQMEEYFQTLGEPIPVRGYYRKVDLKTPESFAPDDPRVEIHAFGDYHGSIHAFVGQHATNKDEWYNRYEDGVPVARPKLKKHVRLVFLGDYIDRGFYSLEVLYLILRLALENPEQVFFISGNHEEPSANDHTTTFADPQQLDRVHRDAFCKYGFTWELQRSRKSGLALSQMSVQQLVDGFSKFFQSLPKGLIAETDMGRIQFTHGVMEKNLWTTDITYDDATQTWIGVPNHAELSSFLEDSTRRVFPVLDAEGICWSDVGELKPNGLPPAAAKPPGNPAHIITYDGPMIGTMRLRTTRPTLGPEVVEKYLKQFKIRTIVRGHQHNQSLSLLTGWQKDATANPKWATQNKGIGTWVDARKAITEDGDGGMSENYDMATFFSYMPAWGNRAGTNSNSSNEGSWLSQFDAAAQDFKAELYDAKNPILGGRPLPLVITTSSSTWSCIPRDELGAWAPAITFTTKLKSEVDRRDAAEKEVARQRELALQQAAAMDTR